MSSPLRRHTKRFAGSVRNLLYRLYPQGVSSPQLTESAGTRLTDDDYCAEAAAAAVAAVNLNAPATLPFCRNGGRCYNTNEGAACVCESDFEGRQCEKSETKQAT